MPDGQRRAPATIELAARPVIDLVGVRLEPSTLTLHGRAARATVEPRVMQVLVALVDAAGSVASRESLFASCWGGLVVGDDALHRAVAGARRALREAGADDLAIETIPRVGYRLVSTAAPPGLQAPTPLALPESASEDSAHTAVPAAVPPEAPAAAAPEAPDRSQAAEDLGRPRRRTLVAAVAALGLSAAAAAVWQRQRAEAVPAEVAELLAQGQRALRLAVPEADRQASSFFEQATVLAPRHALAWGLLAAARQQMSVAAPPAQLVDRLAAVEAAAAQALVLDPLQPDALTARAMQVPTFGEWGRVALALQAVLDRHPDHLAALDSLATLMSSTGLVAAHYPLRLKTVELDRFHAGYNFRSIYSHWMNGQVAAADRAGERGLELWPRHLPTWLARHALFKYTGRVDRAQAMLNAADGQPPLPTWLKGVLHAAARALASGSQADRATARDTLLQSLDGGGPLAAIGATMDLAALGETALALDITEAFLLERGPVIAGTAWQPGQALHHDVRHRFTNHLFLPVSAPLRAHPRFAVIMQDVGMAAHWARSDRPPDHLVGLRSQGASRPGLKP